MSDDYTGPNLTDEQLAKAEHAVIDFVKVNFAQAWGELEQVAIESAKAMKDLGNVSDEVEKAYGVFKATTSMESGEDTAQEQKRFEQSAQHMEDVIKKAPSGAMLALEKTIRLEASRNQRIRDLCIDALGQAKFAAEVVPRTMGIALAEAYHFSDFIFDLMVGAINKELAPMEEAIRGGGRKVDSWAQHAKDSKPKGPMDLQ